MNSFLGIIIFMKLKQKWLIVGNWKMNPVSLKLAKQNYISAKKASLKIKNTELVICPPFIYMESFKSTTRMMLGSQDLFWEGEGSFTGSVSYLQLKNLGVKYSIIGHSEKRKNGESNEDINKKVKASLRGNISPIICVGEEVRDDHGEYLKTVKEQIESAVVGLSKNTIKDIVIAYEPVWAIGKDAKRDATVNEIFETVIYIKKVLSDIYGTKTVPPTKILYGGSVNEKNSEMVLKSSGVDGLLVGRVSLDGKKFGDLLLATDKLKR